MSKSLARLLWVALFVASLAAASVAWPVQQDLGAGYLDWPLGREDATGEIIPGHDVRVQQNYANDTCACAPGQEHAGLDLHYADAVGGWQTTVAAPVSAVADGVVLCDNGADPGGRNNYPGRVVVIRHELPDGSVVYSQYAHLRFPAGDPRAGGREELQDPSAVQVNQAVRRGERVGTVVPWPDDPDTPLDDINNTHLHFEIRQFPYWSHRLHEPVEEFPAEADNPDQVSCAGPGYAPPGYTLDAQPWDKKWLDPVASYYAHRPPYPRSVLTQSFGERRNVRQRPSGDAHVIGSLPVGSWVTAEGVRADQHSEDNWWYEVLLSGGRRGWVAGFVKDDSRYGANLIVGEPLRLGPDWRPPISSPLIEYLFEDPAAFAQGVVPNSGRFGNRLYNGAVEGEAGLVPRLELSVPDSNLALQLDGETAFVETEDSRDLWFSTGVSVEADIWREANRDEDAIVSKWYEGTDEWILTLYPNGNGSLIFTVHLRDGRYETVEYRIPDSDYLERWVHVAASYDLLNGLRLYWQGMLVAQRSVEGSIPLLVRGRSSIHIGDAGAGTDWARFQGRIDEVRIW